MKLKILLLSSMLMFAGCTSGEMLELANAYGEINKNSKQETTYVKPTIAAPTPLTYGTVKYQDNTVMGTTRAEPIVNNGYRIYSMSTGNVVGFIQTNGLVNNFGGIMLGTCTGSIITSTGMLGDCTIPVSNPANKPIYTNPGSGVCADTRNGDFNPSYSPSVCNANGYFWCSIQKACTNQPTKAVEWIACMNR